MATKQKIIIFSVLFIVVLTIFFYLLFFVSVKKIKQAVDQILDTQKKLVETRQKIKNLGEFEKEKTKIKENLELLKASFVDKEFPLVFINFLEKNAKDLNLTQDISLRKSEKGFLSFQIKIVGAPQNIFKFLSRIENSPYLIKLEKINISKTEAKKDEENISSDSLNLLIFLKVKTNEN